MKKISNNREPVRVHRRAKAIALVLHNAEQRVAGFFILSILALAFLYMYFIGFAVVHAVERKEIEHNIAQTGSRIADLEVGYLERKNSITPELAGSLGFNTIAQKDYVERSRYLGRADVQ